MSEQLQLRRGTSAQVLAFTGAQGEVVVDTTNNRAVVEDGATAGGFPAAKYTEVGTIIGGFADLVNFNSGNTDTAITINLPAGVTNYKISSILIANPSASLSTATFGVFTAAAAGGTAIVTAATAITITTASGNTNNNMMSATVNNQNTMSFNLTTLYFRVATAQGSAATGSVIIHVQPLP